MKKDDKIDKMLEEMEKDLEVFSNDIVKEGVIDGDLEIEKLNLRYSALAAQTNEAIQKERERESDVILNLDKEEYLKRAKSVSQQALDQAKKIGQKVIFVNPKNDGEV